jgi:hypothetical protein
MTKYLCFQNVDVVDRISVIAGVVSAPHWAGALPRPWRVLIR